jgi:hypothetical protein
MTESGGATTELNFRRNFWGRPNKRLASRGHRHARCDRTCLILIERTDRRIRTGNIPTPVSKMVDCRGRTLFRNLYYFCPPFRDHNWSDFFDDLRQDKESYIEGQLREASHGYGPEPYFYSIFPVTLRPESCESFLKSTDLPITARDYYLSKLFQFLYVPLEVNFPLEDRDDIRKSLEEFLDGIPVEYAERLAEFDWSEFYNDSRTRDLEDVLRRLPLHLPISKQKPSSEKMTKKRWVDEKWPRLLKQVRGTDPQKMAAQRCGVSLEAYKKWEEGVRPPAPKNMGAVRHFIAESKSET